MFPYITVFWMNIYMTWIWIFVSFLVFLTVSAYLIKKYHQDYLTFFYRVALMIVLTYFLGKYVQFAMDFGPIPSSFEQFVALFSPYGYKFHFFWVAVWIWFAITRLMKKFKSNENKKIWMDILFFSFAFAIIPLWMFLLLWDNFIWKPTDFMWMKALVSYSAWNKFSWVYPIGMWVSVWALISLVYTLVLRRTKKKFWYGALWFVMLIIFTNIALLFQQYPRYLVIWFGNITFDIKQYLSFFIIMYFLFQFYKWKSYEITD